MTKPYLFYPANVNSFAMLISPTTNLGIVNKNPTIPFDVKLEIAAFSPFIFNCVIKTAFDNELRDVIIFVKCVNLF